MQPQEATLIAATVAALATVINLTITVLTKRGEEFRIAQRDIIAEDLKSVGKAIHEVTALSTIQFKLLNDRRYAEKYRAAADAAIRLKEKRMDVRYSLWGLDEALRTLARLPDWIGHTKSKPEFAIQVIEHGQRLSEQIDLAVRSAYLAGRSPGLWRTYWVNRAARHLRNSYEMSALVPQAASDPDT